MRMRARAGLEGIRNRHCRLPRRLGRTVRPSREPLSGKSWISTRSVAMRVSRVTFARRRARSSGNSWPAAGVAAAHEKRRPIRQHQDSNSALTERPGADKRGAGGGPPGLDTPISAGARLSTASRTADPAMRPTTAQKPTKRPRELMPSRSHSAISRTKRLPVAQSPPGRGAEQPSSRGKCATRCPSPVRTRPR